MPHRSPSHPSHLHGRPHHGHPPQAHHLPRWQRRGLYLTVAALTLTGLPWLVIHYTLGEGAGELPHPAEAWLMRLHGLAAFVGLFWFGVIAAAHIPRGWRMSARLRWARQRSLGLFVTVLMTALALSAYAMFYLLPEAWHTPVGWLHAGIGTLLALALPLHAGGLRR